MEIRSDFKYSKTHSPISSHSFVFHSRFADCKRVVFVIYLSLTFFWREQRSKRALLDCLLLQWGDSILFCFCFCFSLNMSLFERVGRSHRCKIHRTYNEFFALIYETAGWQLSLIVYLSVYRLRLALMVYWLQEEFLSCCQMQVPRERHVNKRSHWNRHMMKLKWNAQMIPPHLRDGLVKLMWWHRIGRWSLSFVVGIGYGKVQVSKHSTKQRKRLSRHTGENRQWRNSLIEWKSEDHLGLRT